jgi:hypothetical protein
VFTSDHALKLEWLPNWIAIIGSGYIGLEFSDVYTALGCEVTFIEVRGSADVVISSSSSSKIHAAAHGKLAASRWLKCKPSSMCFDPESQLRHATVTGYVNPTAAVPHACFAPLHCSYPRQAMDKIMPGFDTEIARTAERLLIKGRKIDYHTGVIATKVTPGVPGALQHFHLRQLACICWC